jgi:hypothetical protein
MRLQRHTLGMNKGMNKHFQGEISLESELFGKSRKKEVIFDIVYCQIHLPSFPLGNLARHLYQFAVGYQQYRRILRFFPLSLLSCSQISG